MYMFFSQYEYDLYSIASLIVSANQLAMCTQGRIGNEKVICHVMGLGAPYRKFQSQLQ